MKEKAKTTKSISESIRKELARLSKLYKARKAALEKMSKSILQEDEMSDKEPDSTIHK